MIVILSVKDMIQGVELRKIKEDDYTRRFVLLRKAMKQYEQILKQQGSSCYNQPQIRKYQGLLAEMSELQKLAASSNQQLKNRETQFNLVLNDLDKKYADFIQSLQKSSSQYEETMMKGWRNAINQKKQKDFQYSKLKKANGGSNKNLMFLTSEILKNNRTFKARLEDQRTSLLTQIKQLQSLLHQEQLQTESALVQLSEKCQAYEQQYKDIELKRQKELDFKVKELKLRILQVRTTIMAELDAENQKCEAMQKQIYEVLEEIVSKLKRKSRSR